MLKFHARTAASDPAVTTSAQLARIFDQAATNRDYFPRLVDALTEYVDFCREAGLPPEKMLIAVKRALGYGADGLRVASPMHAELVSRAISECIRRYYEHAPSIRRAD
jgi:hypothetical protein